MPDRRFELFSRSLFAVLLILMTEALFASNPSSTKVASRIVGKMHDGTPINSFTLTSPNAEVEISSLGATITSLKVPNRAGRLQDVVLGFDSAKEYLDNVEGASVTYFGATIGRYANRIAHGRFVLDGKTYSLPKNNGENSLHGGPRGFFSVLWNGKAVPNGVRFEYTSRDGEEGYPGTLHAAVQFTLIATTVRIEYSARTDKDTVINLTNHSYFNLSGNGGDVLHHRLTLHAAAFTPVDRGLIPTGKLRPVAGTVFDFRKAKSIGQDIDSNDEQLQIAGGFDHNWILEGAPGALKEAAEVEEPSSGRRITVYTTEPGVQFYSGNFLDGSVAGKNGVHYAKYAGFCLETQHFPDSPNHPTFPSTVLKPGQTYHSVTEFRFSVR